MKKYGLKRILAKVKKTMKERETNDKNTTYKDNYKSKIRRHKMVAVGRFLIVAAVLAALAGIVYSQYKNHIYTDYEILSEKIINQAAGAQSMRLGDSILTYSHDGVHCTDKNGTEVWNQTFEMQDIMIATCGDVVAISDYNGREVYVLNTKEKICQITTTMPIKNIAVSAEGRVAVAVIDGKDTWIHVYENDGRRAFEQKTTMSQSGYPVEFSFSPNGELLAMSCIFVDAGVVKSQIVFYNLGPVGSNKTDFFVSADTYPDVIIPYIKFLSNSMAVAVGDDRILFYSGSQVPALHTTQLLEDEIQGIYQDGDYIGVLFRSDMIEMRNKIDIYRSDAQKMGTYYFNIPFYDMIFTKDYFVAYADTQCVIKTYDDIEKFSGSFDRAVDLLIPVGKGIGYKFAMVSDGRINTIQLK